MKAKQRKLIPAIAMLVVAAVTLTSASYAWFTMSREVTATGIKLTATAPTNLLIASGKTGDAADWLGADSGDYSNSTTVTVDGGKKLMPVSSGDGVNLYKADKLVNANGTGSEDTLFSAVNKAADVMTRTQDGYYVDIPLWLKSTGNTDIYVQLDNTGTTITDSNNKSIYKAARVALLTEDGAKAITDGLTLESGYTKDGYMRSYDATRTYLDGTSGPIQAANNTKDENAWIGTAEKADNFSTSVAGDKKVILKMNAAADAEAGTVVPLTVRIWIEGQDANCITDNAAQAFEVALKFTATEIASTPTS